MATPSFEKAQQQLEKYFKQLKNGIYAPWLNIRSGRQMSRRSLLHGIKSGRLHHLLSSGETNLFHRNESNPRVANIFEQFPLTDLALAFEISKELNIVYPTDMDGNAVVMSTDQILQVRDRESGECQLLAQTFKYSSDFDTAKRGKQKVRRMLAKLEIERRYWAEKVIAYQLKNELTTPKVHSENLAFLRESAYQLHLFRDDLDRIVEACIDTFLNHPELPLLELITVANEKLRMDHDLLYKAIQYGIWNERIPFDHSFEFNPLDPLRLIY